MIDVKILRTEPQRVRDAVASRNASTDVDELIRFDAEVRTLQTHLDELRHGLKAQSASAPSAQERAELQEMSREIKSKEAVCHEIEIRRDELLQQLPNLNDPETPIGKTDADNVVVKTVGAKPKFDFEPLPYFELPSVKKYLKTTEGVRTSGSRFYYLTGKLAQLQRAVFEMVHEIISAEGFELVAPPVLVRERAMFGTGHFPAERNEVYRVNPDEDDLYLVGTAEVPLISLHDGEVLSEEELPKKYFAQTMCFRREAGSYGKDQAGILRVHQFQKIEMVAFVRPEESAAMHAHIREIEEKILSSFGLHYHILDICSGDLGYPASRKWDLEAWFPSQQKFRELTSTSNTTDFQSRRLNIRYGSSKNLVHTVNGTGVTDRLILALLEQNQLADGSVELPENVAGRLGWRILEP